MSFLFALITACAWAAEPIKITVYHTNDVHGWIMSRPASWDAKNPARLIGGAAALASYVRKDAGPKLFLDAGDWFQGTPEGTLSRGRASVDCMNALGYDATVVGNHEFDFQESRLKELVSGLNIPVLGANVYEEKTGRRVNYLKPYVIKEIAGVKVGIFGLLTVNMRNLTFPKNYAGLRFRREIDEARDMVRALRERGADVVIALTHVGFRQSDMAPFEDDKFLAAEVPGIDLIVGGHTHTRLAEPARDPKNGTLIVQAGCYLSEVGKATLEIDPETKKVAASRGELVDLWIDETGEAADLKKIVSRYKREAGRALDVAVGTAAAALTRNRFGESSLGDWMTDCERSWAGADAAFHNSGGIRADLPAGPVTLRRLFEIMPFDNYVETFTMTGAQIREVLERGAGAAAGMIQMGGVRFRYHQENDPGHRVTAAWVGDRPLDDAARYKVAAADFLASGGDGYSVFAETKDKSLTRTLLRDVMASCVRRHPMITAAPGERILKE